MAAAAAVTRMRPLPGSSLLHCLEFPLPCCWHAGRPLQETVGGAPLLLPRPGLLSAAPRCCQHCRRTAAPLSGHQPWLLTAEGERSCRAR